MLAAGEAERDKQRRQREQAEAASAAAAGATATVDEQSECVVCIDRARDAVLVPCGHNFCMVCAEGVVARGDACPTCRGRVREAIRSYV